MFCVYLRFYLSKLTKVKYRMPLKTTHVKRGFVRYRYDRQFLRGSYLEKLCMEDNVTEMFM